MYNIPIKHTGDLHCSNKKTNGCLYCSNQRTNGNLQCSNQSTSRSLQCSYQSTSRSLQCSYQSTSGGQQCSDERERELIVAYTVRSQETVILGCSDPTQWHPTLFRPNALVIYFYCSRV